MEPNQRMLPPSTSAVNIEVSLNHRRKDLPADSISAIQVKHDASVSMKLPRFDHPRYRSEAFVVLSSTPLSALQTKFVNSLDHIPSASTVESRGSKFTRGALKSNGEECNQCVFDQSKKLNGGANQKSNEPKTAQRQRLQLNSIGCEEKALKKQNALDRDTKRHCSPLRRQCRVQFENETALINDPPTTDDLVELSPESKASSIQADTHFGGGPKDPSNGNWNPINELRKFIEEEKEQQNLPNDIASKEPCEQLETSTDSVESGSEVNPLWVLDSITASVEKCNYSTYDTILEEGIEGEIVLDGPDGITQNTCSGEAETVEISGAAVDGRTVPQNQEEEGENKRLSQGSNGSFGFEPHVEEDFSGYVEGKEYFKNLPTFHRLLTSAEKEELDDEQMQKNELAALRLEDQIPGLHEQSDYAQDMMDTHAMRSEYWDYPYPSQSDAFDAAMRSDDKNELLENMRMKVRGRLRQPGNSSSDSGCQDTDVNHSSIDESDATHRIHSPKGRYHEVIEEDKTQTHGNTYDHSADFSEEREQEKVEMPDEKEASSPAHPSSHRRQILEGLKRLIASSEETSCSLPIPEDGNLESGTQKRKSFIGSRVINEAPTIPARPMTHGQLKFVHYENITIVKKRINEDRNAHEDNEMHLNTPSNKQSPEFVGDDESSKFETDKRLVHTINEESVAEPIDIDLSDPEVLEATKRMQLAFRKRRGPHGSKKFRSLQRMRAESDSVMDRGLGLDNSTPLDKHNPFPGDVSMEKCEVPMSRHHSLPPNFMHSLSECSFMGDDSLSTTLKNKDMTKERVCKKLSRQKSVSQYPSFPPSLTERREEMPTECELVNQAGHETILKIENIEMENQSLVVSERAGGQELSEHRCNPSSTNVTEIVKPNHILAETAEGEDVDEKLKCILGSEPANTSHCAQTEPVCDALQEPDIDLKDPKLEDASKMIQQVFRRKKLLSKRSRGSVEEKACKKVQANKLSSGNVSFPDIPLLEETPNELASENALAPSILYADTTVNVVIAEVDLDKQTNSNEQQPMNQTKNTSKDNGNEPSEEPLPVITPAPINYQTYKGVMIVDDKLSNHLETDSKAPSSDVGSVIHADANANFRTSFEKSHVVKRASSISEASLGDEIDIDLLDAEVQAVTEKLRSESFVEKSPNDVRIHDHASTNDTDLGLKKECAGNQISNCSQSHSELAKESQVKEKVSEKSKTNGDIDIDLSDPDVQKTAFKLQSAFWKKRTSNKSKSQTTSTKEAMCRNSMSASKNMFTGATVKNKNGSLIKNRNGKGGSNGDQSNHNELDSNIKRTGESLNEVSEPNITLISSLKRREQDKTGHSATNNDGTRARPQSSNTNTANLLSTSSNQTEEIDIDLNDTKVKEATRKIQNIFKRKRTPKKTTETADKVESKKSVARLKSNAVISLGSKHQTKPMISTSFLDRGENERKETKAPMVSPDCHGNTDGDEGMKRSSNRCGVGEPEKTNDGLTKDSKISDPRGTLDKQTELSRLREGSPLSSIDEHSSKFEATSYEHTTPSIQRDDGRITVGKDVSNSSHSRPHQSDLDKGAKGDKFNIDNNGSRPVSCIHYANIDPSPMPPASSAASLLRMQDEVDIDNLMTASTTTRESNGYVKNNSPVTCSVTSLTTAPLNRRNRDRDDDVDSLKLKSTSTIGNSGKAVHGYLDHASDDTEYETAYSDFSDRVDDELERTLVQEDAMSTKLTQMETTIHHHSPRFLIRPKNVTCYHGDRARFVCCITGSPRPDISWFASGKVIRPERDNRLQITDYSEDEDGNGGINACAQVSILEIVEVKFLDNGEYACVAINSQGQAFSSAHLKIETPDPGPPEEHTGGGNDRLSGDTKNETSIRANVNSKSSLEDLVHISSSSLPRQKVQALVGSKASFFCPVEGDPLPDVKWFKDDIPITSNHGDDRVAVRVEGCIHCLQIRNILVSDAGTYLCSAANDRGTVLCVSLLEVQESLGATEGNQQVKQRTPMLVITEPEVFRQTTSEANSLVSLQSNNKETVVALDSLNTPNNNTPNHCNKTASGQDAVNMLKDDKTEDNSQPNANSSVAADGSTDEILSSVLSTYGPRDPSQNNCDDRLVLSNDGLTCMESNSSENYASAEGPPCDDAQQDKNKVPNGTIPTEGDSLTEMKHLKSSKRRSLRRNHVKSPTKNNHSALPGDKDIIEDIGLDDVNGLTRSKSSRKKRSSSSRRKKSPIHSKNVERVRLDLEKAEELTEKVDSCLDIIDDLLTLTSYDENENETEEKLRQKLDTLVHKFADSESDAASMSSIRSTPSHRRKEKLRKVDLLNMSDSNGECLDGSDVNLNVSRIHSDGNIWGPCSLEDSLKVMSELVGNISVTVRDTGLETGVTTQASSADPIVNDREENLNNNNNIHWKGKSNSGPITGQNVKRTPLRDLLKHSLFSQELMTTRVRRRPLPVTRSLDSVDDITYVPRSSDGKRRHSFGSLYAPRTSRPSRHPLLRTLSIRRRNRAHSTESSSSDDDNPGTLRGMNIARRPRSFDTGHTSDECPSHAESSDSLPVEQEDKFQQFPDSDRLSSPIGFEDSDCSLEDHNLAHPNITMRLVDDGSFITNTGRLSEYANVHRVRELFKDNVSEESVSANQQRENSVGQSTNDMSKRFTNTQYDSQHKNIVMTVENSSKAVRITRDHVSHNSTSKHRIPQAISSNIQDRDVDDEEDQPATLLNVSRNDSGFSSGVSPLSTDR